MTIGARVLKTGLAVAFALWAGMLIGLTSPIVSAVAAIFTIQPSIHRSWKQILEQVQSNLLGAAVAIAAVRLVGSTPISVGIVCVCVILLCLRFGTEETIGLSLVTVVVVMEAGGNQGWMTAADRFGGIMTGILSAFFVNILVAPPKHRERFVKMVQEARSRLSRLLRTAVSNELKESVFRDEQQKLRSEIRKLEEFYELYAEERLWGKTTRMERARLLVIYRSMLNALHQGMALIEALEDYFCSVRAANAWDRVIDRQIEALCGYHEQLMWKWEGQMKPGALAAAPPPEASVLLNELMMDRSGDGDTLSRARLMVISASIFSYEEKLRRLDKLMENWLHREENGAGEKPHRKREETGTLSE